jgi:hypothetical protein
MTKGEVINDPGNNWHEPAHVLLGQDYHMRAFGSLYVLSGSALRDVIIPNTDRLRLLGNEGVVLASRLALVIVKRLSTMSSCAQSLLQNAWQGECGACLDLDSCHFSKQARMLASMLRCLLYCEPVWCGTLFKMSSRG